MFFTGVIKTTINIYILMVFIHAILSWFQSMRGGQIEAILGKAVEPALKPIRKLIAPIQGNTGMDFSPAVLILGLMILRGIL